MSAENGSRADDYEEGTDLYQVAWWAEESVAALWERNEAIKDAHGHGWSLREIADAAGLSHAGVKKIVER